MNETTSGVVSSHITSDVVNKQSEAATAKRVGIPNTENFSLHIQMDTF